MADAYDDPERGAGYRPDVALINHYDADARLGLHRDSDKAVLEPVVSLSLGAACVFRLGNVESRGRPWTDVELLCALIANIGVTCWCSAARAGSPTTACRSCLPDVEVPDVGLAHGRLNPTLRVSGLT